MAYKKQNTVDYFPHAVNHGRKMFIIRNEFGNDGYSVWFMLLEQLGKSNNHFIDLNEKTQLLYLSAEMQISEDLFLKIIELLVTLNEFDFDLWTKANVIYSKKFVENILEVYKRRKNDLLTYSQICMQFSVKCKQDSKNVVNIPQSRVEESRVEETLENFELEPYNYLKKEWQSKTQIFEMQNKKSFPDYDNFIMNFNSKVVEEKLDFEPKILWARLQRLNSNWTKEPKKSYPVTKKLNEKLDKHG